MNTLRKTSASLRELTDAQAETAYAWAKANEESNALAKSYVEALVSLGCMLEIDMSALAVHLKVNKGASKKQHAMRLIDAALNPLFDLRRVLGNAVLEEMKS